MNGPSGLAEGRVKSPPANKSCVPFLPSCVPFLPSFLPSLSSLLSSLGNTLGPEWDIDVFSNKFSWRKYLEETSGSKQDFLNETWETAELKYGKGKVHTHHIAMKKGLGEAGKAAVDRTHEMLINLGIDPIFDRENLAFLPKGGHPDDYAIAVEKAIKEVVDNSLGQAGAKRKLREVAEQWARKHKWKPGH